MSVGETTIEKGDFDQRIKHAFPFFPEFFSL